MIYNIIVGLKKKKVSVYHICVNHISHEVVVVVGGCIITKGFYLVLVVFRFKSYESFQAIF